MADINYEFKNTYQKECYEKVGKFCQELYGEMAHTYDERPQFSIRFGSAIVIVYVQDWGDDDSTVSVYSWVIKGAEMTSELMSYLLTKNYDIRFGAFSIDSDGDIHFEHTIVGSTLDKGELQASIMGVANIADSYDDEIQQRWGGTKGMD
jgi:hypothetical protein